MDGAVSCFRVHSFWLLGKKWRNLVYRCEKIQKKVIFWQLTFTKMAVTGINQMYTVYSIREPFRKWLIYAFLLEWAILAVARSRDSPQLQNGLFQKGNVNGRLTNTNIWSISVTGILGHFTSNPRVKWAIFSEFLSFFFILVKMVGFRAHVCDYQKFYSIIKIINRIFWPLFLLCSWYIYHIMCVGVQKRTVKYLSDLPFSKDVSKRHFTVLFLNTRFHRLSHSRSFRNKFVRNGPKECGPRSGHPWFRNDRSMSIFVILKTVYDFVVCIVCKQYYVTIM